MKAAIPNHYVPYHRALISEEEIQEVVETLRSGWLTTGPKTRAFEERFSALKSGRPCVAVNSCTAGLFLAVCSLDLKPGDEVITTPMTFVSTANVIVQNGGSVVFADIDRKTLNIDPARIERKIGPKTRAILPVHVGGNPCEMDKIMELAAQHGLAVIEDCAHSIESEFAGQPLGTFGMAASFSFYPTKNITTGEGGMVVCKDEKTASMIRLLSLHGIDKGTWQRMEVERSPLYDVVIPGYKYNMSDLQAALGLPQLDKLEEMYERRKAIRVAYDSAFGALDTAEPVQLNPRGKSALHLYQMLLNPDALAIDREAFISRAREMGVELSVNYTPVHLFSWYRNKFCSVPGAYPVAEYCGANVISLPFYPAMSNKDVDWVIQVILELLEGSRR